MKAIVECSDREVTSLSDAYVRLHEKVSGTTRADWFKNYTERSGYAHYDFSGTYTDKRVELLGREPSENEIIMLVDGSFSNFGAQCTITGRHFTGRVNAD